jgi:hypothetical protein
MSATRIGWARAALAALALAAAGLAAAAWRGPGDEDEKQVRLTAFRYYSGMVMGDADTCVAAVGFPIHVVRNGAATTRDERALRALVAEVAKRSKNRDLGAEQRKELLANMLAVFDSAAIQFIGGDTAAVTFLVRPAPNRNVGDVLAHLVLHRRDGKWRVIAEFTDAKPTPTFADPTDGPAPQPSLEKRP